MRKRRIIAGVPVAILVGVALWGIFAPGSLAAAEPWALPVLALVGVACYLWADLSKPRGKE